MAEDLESASFLLILLTLLILTLLLNQLTKKIPFIQISGISIIIGFLVGGIIYELYDDLSWLPSLSRDVLILFLIPLIIFESGFNMEAQSFFKQLGTTMLIALLGTFLSSILIGVLMYEATGTIYEFTSSECFIFGALISATDPISVLSIMKEANAEKSIYNIIFGESIFNDAVAIVLYETIFRIHQEGSDSVVIVESIFLFIGIFIGSILVGLVVSAMGSLVLKKTSLDNQVRLEACVVIFGPWIAYLLAEVCQLSGIVSVLLCGILMARYTYPNLSSNTQKVLGSVYHSVAGAAEILVFIVLGLGIFAFDLPYSDMGATTFFCAFFIVVFARCVVIFVCCLLVNPFRTHKIGIKKMFFLVFSGFRGAIAFALALDAVEEFEKAGEVILNITILYAITSVIGGGFFINCLVKKLGFVQNDEAEEPQRPKKDGKCKKCRQWFGRLERGFLYPFLVKAVPADNDIEAEESSIPENHI